MHFEWVLQAKDGVVDRRFRMPEAMEYEGISMSEEQKTGVYKAIVKVTEGLAKEGIGKNRRNQQQGYQFRGIDDVYNALSTHLAQAGLCILPRIVERVVQERQTKSGGVLFYVTVEAEYDLVSSEDGSKHTVRIYGEAMDSADKATNKAMSAAYKYMAFQTFAIPTEGDNDADANTPEPAPLPEYSESDFLDNLPAWKDRIGGKKITASQLIAMISTKYRLSDEQKETIKGL